MSEELKPCGFCGSCELVNLWWQDHPIKIFGICCEECNYFTKSFLTEAEAIAAWNTRPIEDELRKNYAILEQQLKITLEAHNDLEDELEQKYRLEDELRARVKELEQHEELLKVSVAPRWQ